MLYFSPVVNVGVIQKTPVMFGINKPYFLGIDFGTSYIKAVELTLRKGLPELVNYGYIEMSFTEGKNAALAAQSPEKSIHDYLGALLKTFMPKAKAINMALPGFSGLITLIELPEMEAKELDQAIQFEAHKYIPAPLEDVAFSWEVISQNGKSGDVSGKKTMEVLLVAALKKEVSKFERYIDGIGMPVDLLELEIFSLARAVSGDKVGSSLIVDIGSRATNLVLVRDGDVRLNRSLNTGGNEITSTLSEGLGISWERAEELKCGTKDFLTQPESALVFSTLDVITSEVRRIFTMYAAKEGSDALREIILSGGTAKMQGLPAYLTNLFHVPVSIADPWQGIQVADALRPVVGKLGPSFAIAVGLALGGVDRYRKK
ncbi:MAG: type IV pilus assembly protein PilM [Candidatus Moraniibacteriota bacterium]